MYKQTTILLSLTNIIGLLCYNNECSANKYYREKLNRKNKIINILQSQFITSQENLKTLVIKIKNNDLDDIDKYIDKYIDYKCPKWYTLWTDADD
jgi:hypothetical protein